jgi:transposase
LHLCSWAGVAPGNKQSGGKRLHASTNKGNAYLRAVLAEAVWVISHTKDNSLSAQYHRLARRQGREEGHCGRQPQLAGHHLSSLARQSRGPRPGAAFL